MCIQLTAVLANTQQRWGGEDDDDDEKNTNHDDHLDHRVTRPKFGSKFLVSQHIASTVRKIREEKMRGNEPAERVWHGSHCPKNGIGAAGEIVYALTR